MSIVNRRGVAAKSIKAGDLCQGNISGQYYIATENGATCIEDGKFTGGHDRLTRLPDGEVVTVENGNR